MKNIYILFILFIGLASCTEEIPLDLNNGDNQKLVVEAWLSDLPEQQSIRLTLTTDYFNQEKANIATGAVVEITEGANTYSLTEAANGYYNLPSNFQLQVGMTYDLSINYNGINTVATSTVNRVAAIDSLEAIEENPIEDEGFYSFLLFAQEPAGLGDSYYWRNFKKGEEPSDTLSRADFAEDELVDGNYINGASVTWGDYSVGDTAVVDMMSISREAHDYFLAVLLQTVFRGGPFDTPPADVPDNISGDAHGFFITSAVSRMEIIIE